MNRNLCAVFIAVCAAELVAGEFKSEIRAADFKTADIETASKEYRKNSLAEQIRKSGNLAGKTEKTKSLRISGRFSYEFSVPEDGWYVISTLPEGNGYDYTVDGRMYAPFRTEPQPGSVYLKAGKHSLEIGKIGIFSPVTGFEIRKARQEECIGIEIANPFLSSAVIRKGATFDLKITRSGQTKKRTLGVILQKGKKEYSRLQFELPPSVNYAEKIVRIPAAAEGVFQVSFELDSAPLPSSANRKFELVVIDAAPLKPEAKEAEKTLVAEIDCVKTTPDYTQGKTQIIHKDFGSYLETDNCFGFARSAEKRKNASWAAWKLSVPETNVPYLFEFEYPDDTERSAMFAVRSANDPMYPRSTSADCGGEFRLSNQMKTASLIHWVPDHDIRVLVTPGAEDMRGAISRIRVYKFNSPTLPPMLTQKKENRNYINFYEEEGSIIGTYCGEKYLTASTEKKMEALKRFLSLASYMGCSEILFGIEVYGGGLYPTAINTVPWGRPYTFDLARAMLLTAERYGLKIMFDFHPVRMGNLRAVKGGENCLRDQNGNYAYWTINGFQVNPIHPDTVKWSQDMLTEFTRRYKDSPSFKGVSLRQMSWQNPGWCNFSSIRYGYDDYTIGRFEQDTGIKVPRNYRDSRLYAERYRFLTGPARKEWIQWRCRKITDLFRSLKEKLSKECPGIVIQTARCGLRNMSIDIATIEAGVDPDMLEKAGIFVEKNSGTIGRTKGPKQNRLELLKSFHKKDGKNLYYVALPYLEGGQQLALYSQLGLKRKKDTPFYGGASWASGENLLQPYSTPLARLDTDAFSTGGISYTFADRSLRTFMNEFRRLRRGSFETLALDPVAIRRDKDQMYAVNSLPVPVRVKMSLKNGSAVRLTDGSPFHLSDFELRPYQLLTFKVSGTIGKIETLVPEAYHRQVEQQAAQLSKASAKQKELEALNLRIQDAWKKKEYWKISSQLELNADLMREHGLVIPSMRGSGQMTVPENAYRQPVGKVEKIQAERVIPSWKNETFLRADSIRFRPEIKADGKYEINIAFAGGKENGSIEVLLNGKTLGILENVSSEPYVITANTGTKVLLKRGTPEIELRSADGRKISVLYMTIDSVYERLPPEFFLLSASQISADTRNMERVMNRVDPAEKDRNFNGKNWTAPIPLKSNPYFINAGQTKVGTTAYALTHINSPEPCVVEISFGADYFFKIWCNGEIVSGFNHTHGSSSPDQFQFLLPLKKGRNELLIKIGSGSSDNGFWLSINNPGGLTFSGNKKVKVLETSSILDIDFSKQSTDELKQLHSKALKINAENFRLWDEFNRKNAPENLKKAWQNALKTYTEMQKLKLELLKSEQKYARTVAAFQEQFRTPHYVLTLGGGGYSCRMLHSGAASGEKNKLQKEINRIWNESGLSKDDRYISCDEAAYEANRKMNEEFAKWWRTDREAGSVRSEVLAFHHKIQNLQRELRKR